MSWITPVTLKGKYVTLVPLSMEHFTDLIEATKDGELWKIWYVTVPSPEGMEAEITNRLKAQAEGNMLAFSVIDNASNKAIGMTTYFKIVPANRRLDIGWTWYRKSAQKSPVNTECKLLLLQHAFEKLNCIAVGFGANFFNLNSQRAIERLGAKFDGSIRNYRIMPNGIVCDFCLYSIIDSEWPAIKHNLKSRLVKIY